MARYYPIAFTLCTILALLLFWSTGIQSALQAPSADGPSRGTPHLRLEEPRRDLGQIAVGKSAHADFRVHNDGSRRLVIRKETGHCCGRGGPEEITLVPPGDSAVLTVEVDATGIQGGLQQEIVYSTNDPRMPRLTLTVVGHVER